MASAKTPIRAVDPQVINPTGSNPVVLICEHASNWVPDQFDQLGLDETALQAHIAWDPGAFETARRMAEILDSPLVYSTVSRLVYDCNRPPEADSAIPQRSENADIPGNRDLSPAARQHRVDTYYRPFEGLVSEVLDKRPIAPILVTIHSFTPTFLGRRREVEIGVVHDDDSRLADAFLNVAGADQVERNEPYGPDDGVTHTLRRHALPRGLLNVMIEIRNDLITTPQQCQTMADKLVGWLELSLSAFQMPIKHEAVK